jgi:hypothetical protein
MIMYCSLHPELVGLGIQPTRQPLNLRISNNLPFLTQPIVISSIMLVPPPHAGSIPVRGAVSDLYNASYGLFSRGGPAETKQGI